MWTYVCKTGNDIVQCNWGDVIGIREDTTKSTNEIRGYKELLNERIITEEEFSIKEKELLFSIRKKILRKIIK